LGVRQRVRELARFERVESHGLVEACQPLEFLAHALQGRVLLANAYRDRFDVESGKAPLRLRASPARFLWPGPVSTWFAGDAPMQVEHLVNQGIWSLELDNSRVESRNMKRVPKAIVEPREKLVRPNLMDWHTNLLIPERWQTVQHEGGPLVLSKPETNGRVGRGNIEPELRVLCSLESNDGYGL